MSDQQYETRTTARTFDLDPQHSVVAFRVKHLMVSTVTGRFGTARGTIYLDGGDAARSRVEAQIDAGTIDTGVAERDAHLRSPDFLHADEHPHLVFRSKHVEPRGDQAARIVGDLTIRGVTREVTLDAELDGEIEDPWGKRRLGLTATTTINRRDWGLTWNQVLEAGGVMVSDKVRIDLHIAAVERDPAAV